MLQPDLSFLTKIPDSLGYLVVLDGAIYKVIFCHIANIASMFLASTNGYNLW